MVEDLLNKSGYKCLFCGKYSNETKLTIDHIIPVCKGGDNNIKNLQILCLKCNQSKGSKILFNCN